MCSVGDTDPPLLVLLSVHYDHLALREGQLVWVVGYTVVDGFYSLRPLLLRDGTKAHRQVHTSLCRRENSGENAATQSGLTVLPFLFVLYSWDLFFFIIGNKGQVTQRR